MSNHGRRRTTALQLLPVCPPPIEPDVLPASPEQLPAPPVQQVQDPIQTAQVQVQPGQPPLYRSYFKPEFSGEPEEDAESNLLRTNNWMEILNFSDEA